MSKLEQLDEIAREAWAGNYDRVGVLSTGERLYVALASGRMRELAPGDSIAYAVDRVGQEWMAHMLKIWRGSTQPIDPIFAAQTRSLQGRGEFRRQLEYKLSWSGGELIAVNPRNTSRTCPECGCVDAQNRKTQAVFRCVACGHTAHADVVGAINILARGHRVAACVEDVSRARPVRAQRATSVKQEPAEVTAQELSLA